MSSIRISRTRNPRNHVLNIQMLVTAALLFWFGQVLIAQGAGVENRLCSYDGSEEGNYEICDFYGPFFWPSGPMRFGNFCYDGTWAGNNICNIYAEGEIRPDTVDKLESYLEGIGGAENFGRIILNSKGGHLQGGIQLGRFIRSVGWNTEIGVITRIHPRYGYADDPAFDLQGTWGLIEYENGVCLSACAYAFLGGIARHAETRQIGFHRFSVSSGLNLDDRSALDIGQITATQIFKYIEDMGVSSDLLVEANLHGEGSAYFPQESRLVQLRVVNTGIQEEFEPFKLELIDGEAFAVSRSLTDSEQAHYGNNVPNVGIMTGCRGGEMVVSFLEPISFFSDPHLLFGSIKVPLQEKEFDPEFPFTSVAANIPLTYLRDTDFIEFTVSVSRNHGWLRSYARELSAEDREVLEFVLSRCSK